MRYPAAFIALFVFTAFSTAYAKDAPAPATTPTTQPNTVVTSHEMMMDGTALRYEATTGTLTLHDEQDHPTADFFFVAYTQTEPDVPSSHRPIIFLFNGGPGAASVWLHLGTVGPMRVKLGDIGQAPAPPYQLVPNAQTWLDAADLVFIDPVGTGYSRAAKGKNPSDFYGVEPDVASVGQFIQQYTTLYERWASPKFLAGESYGTTRAASLSNYLHDTYGLDLNGILLISSVLDFQTIQFGNGNDLPYAFYLPTYTATAWYHHKLPPDLQSKPLADVVGLARQWVLENYYGILAQGSSLTPQARKEAVEQLARFTGLTPAIIDEADLRIDPGLFRKRLLGGRELIGRMDTRLSGYAPQPTVPWAEYDPGMDRYLGVYSATFSNYVRQELGYKTHLPYKVLSQQVHWKLQGNGPGYLDVSNDLKSAMLANPHLKVFIANGYFDLATPFFATDYTVNHLKIGAELRQNIVEKYYPGGHMMYHNPAARRQLQSDVTAFIGRAANVQAPASRP